MVKKTNIRATILYRVRLVFLLVVCFSLAIIGRVGYVQYVEGLQWKSKAAENSLRFMKVPAMRGNILSDNGSLLATSLPRYQVAIDPSIPSQYLLKNGDLDSLCKRLAGVFKEQSATGFKRKIIRAREEDRKYLLLSKTVIGYQMKKEMQTWPIFKEGRLAGGVLFEQVDERYRPYHSLAMRTVGFINNEKEGVVGLEYSYNEELEGTNGEALFRKTVGGLWKPVNDGNSIEPQQGMDITTTIDINIQDVAERSLNEALIKNDANYGTAVVMEVKTGAIKAIVNLGKNKDGEYGERYNYAVASEGRTEPGSTIKLASYLALLEDKAINPKDSVFIGDGEFHFYENSLKESYVVTDSTITYEEAFYRSSNVIAKEIYDQYNQQPDRYLNYLHQFGLSEDLDFQLYGEAIPYIKDRTDPTWSDNTLPWMAVGYELELTPLQVLAFYNAIANDGKRVRPYLVKSIKNENKLVEEFKPVVEEKPICSEKTLQTIQKLLVGVVQKGTAKRIYQQNYPVAGKTGTAQKIIDGEYSNKYYTSFVGYFPANKPKYSCIVVIDDPEGVAQHGADVAAPVFREIADHIFSTDLEINQAKELIAINEEGVFPLIRTGYYPDLTALCNELGISNHTSVPAVGEWVGARIVNNAIYWDKKQLAENVLPDVRGMLLKDALYVLENLGLEVSTQGKGRVILQSLPPGTPITEKRRIKLFTEKLDLKDNYS